MADDPGTRAWSAVIEDLERSEIVVPAVHESHPHRPGWKVVRLALVALATVLLSVFLGQPSAPATD